LLLSLLNAFNIIILLRLLLLLLRILLKWILLYLLLWLDDWGIFLRHKITEQGIICWASGRLIGGLNSRLTWNWGPCIYFVRVRSRNFFSKKWILLANLFTLFYSRKIIGWVCLIILLSLSLVNLCLSFLIYNLLIFSRIVNFVFIVLV